jgi:hypothetical protein
MTVINLRPYKEQAVPEVGKEYHTFDDGKVRPSRHSIVTISEVIPFSKCTDEDLLESWRDEVKTCYWLFATETDYFVKAEYDDETSCFVRTTDGGWFSLGFFGSRLDIDGSLYKIMLDQYGEECQN